MNIKSISLNNRDEDYYSVGRDAVTKIDIEYVPTMNEFVFVIYIDDNPVAYIPKHSILRWHVA